jgi:hypothetical protein
MGKVEKRDDAFVAGKRPQSRYISYQVRKTPLFAPFTLKKRSFYQDRLGTNIGKALKKEWRFSHAGLEAIVIRDGFSTHANYARR